MHALAALQKKTRDPSATFAVRIVERKFVAYN